VSARLTAIGIVVAVATGLGVAGAVLHAGDTRYTLPPPTERVLYLRSGRTADRLMLSFDALAADVFWIRTIQHYGRDRKSPRVTGRFELLYPMLDLTTTLDPQFNIAYRFGAIFLAQPAPVGPNRVDQAIALLEKGLANNPTRWQYASDIGFIYYWYGTHDGPTGADYATAAQWFEQAALTPQAPNWLRPLAATTRAQGGDRAGARRLLQELTTSEEAWIRRAAERGLAQVRALDEIDALQDAVNRYSAAHDARPTGWGDLQSAGLLRGNPNDPANVPYQFDPSTNRVTVSPQSPLWPLPRTLGRQ
jgi:hypothetical protein